MLKTRDLGHSIFSLALGLVLTSCSALGYLTGPEQVINEYWHARMEDNTKRVQELTVPAEFGDCLDK